jgi:hypothetical protein
VFDIITNLHLKDSWVERLLKSFQGNNFPPEFIMYVYNLRDNKQITKKWKDSNSNIMNQDDIFVRNCFFGYYIQEVASAAKAEINNHLNPLWLDILPSGCNESGLLESIRKELWPREALRKAKQSVNQMNKRTKKLTSDIEIKEAIDIQTKKNLALMNLEWYPDYWLAYYLCGRPAQDLGLLSCNSGMMIKKRQIDNVSPLQKVRNMSSRNVRRHIDKITKEVNKDNTTTDEEKEEKIVNKSYEITHILQNKSITQSEAMLKINLKLNNYDQQIHLITELNLPDAEEQIRSIKEKKLNILLEQMDELSK